MAKKISMDQRKEMLSYIRENRCLFTNRFGGPNGSQEKERLWAELAERLNSFATGATKDKKQWQKSWVDWKCATKAKAQEIRTYAAGTGGGGACPKQLTGLEEELMGLIGWQSAEGHQEVIDPLEDLECAAYALPDPYGYCKMKPSSQVADKAVSTEDIDSNFFVKQGNEDDDDEEKEKTKRKSVTKVSGTNAALELVRLESVLAALVESKVVSIKMSSSNKKSSINNILRPRSQSTTHGVRQQRLTSTSTTASSTHVENNHHHHHRHHHHHHHHRKRQSDSALLSSGLFPRKRQGHRYHHHRHHHYTRAGSKDEEDRNDQEYHNEEEMKCELLGQQETMFGGSVMTLSPSIAGPSNSLQCGPALHHSPHRDYPNTQSKILANHSNNDSYIFLTMERAEEEDEECLQEHHLHVLDDDDGDIPHIRTSLQEVQRKRKCKKRKKKKIEGNGRVRRVVGGLDPDDLPQRARWTIIATACLLLLMSVLLVGVTLRMAPIIDEMVRKENEEMVNAITRDEIEYNDTILGVPRSSSPSPLVL